MERSRVKAELKRERDSFEGKRFDPLSEIEVVPLLLQWGSWNRKGNGSKLGYAKRTVEGRLQDGELVGIKGSGEYRPPSDPDAESVEAVVSRMSLGSSVYRMMAAVLRLKYVARNHYSEISVKMSHQFSRPLSVAEVKRLELLAVGHIDGNVCFE